MTFGGKGVLMFSPARVGSTASGVNAFSKDGPSVHCSLSRTRTRRLVTRCGTKGVDSRRLGTRLAHRGHPGPIRVTTGKVATSNKRVPRLRPLRPSCRNGGRHRRCRGTVRGSRCTRRIGSVVQRGTSFGGCNNVDGRGVLRLTGQRVSRKNRHFVQR